MKKLFTPLLLLAFTGILLSSCSNSSKLAFTKRHYRSGYFVDFGGSNRSAPAISNSKTPKSKTHQTSRALLVKSESNVTVNAIAYASEKTDKVQKFANPKNIQENYFAVINSNPAYQSILTPDSKVNNDVAGAYGDGPHGHANANVPFVVIVLCAIFIPPLGVGLMYGINNYFWIDLILTLLFFFPGMIFAIIVVLM